MSGGFFRGTSADQDTRFSNKQAKLMKSQKFPAELEHLVDISKVNMDVMRPWITNRVTELLGFEDEVLINFIFGLLDGKGVNGKEVQISLTGFMEKNTAKFMKELWTLLLSAQNNASRIPQQLLDAKEEETRKAKAETDRIANEIQKKKEKEGRELQEEKLRKMDGGNDTPRANDAGLETVLKSQSRPFSAHPSNEKESGERNGSRGRSRVSRSPHSAERSSSPLRRAPSRSASKSVSNSRSYSDERNKSRSLTRSPQPRRRSISSQRVSRSPPRRSISPHRKLSPRQSLSPVRRRSAYSRRRSTSRTRRSPSPVWRRSPVRRRSRSPVRRRSRSPFLRRSRSPLRRGSPMPMRRRSPLPVRRRSPSPVRRRIQSPIRRRSPSPVRRRIQSPIRRRSPSPFHRRSPTPIRRRYQRSPSTPPRRLVSPIRRRSPFRGRRRSPIPSRHRSPSPGESSSQSPVRRASLSPVRRKSPVRRRRSPVQSPRERERERERERTRPHGKVSPVPQAPSRDNVERLVENRKGIDSVAHRPPVSLMSPQRDTSVRNDLREKGPSLSPLPHRSPSRSESPPRARKRSPREDRSPYESRLKQTNESPSRKLREPKPVPASLRASGEKDDTVYAREHGGQKLKSLEKRFSHSSTADDRKEAKERVRHKDEYSPERLPSHQSREAPSRTDSLERRKNGVEMKSVKTSGRLLPLEVPDQSRPPAIHKADGKNHSRSDNVKDTDRLPKPENLLKSARKVDKSDRSGSLDSGSEESDKRIDEVSGKRKHKRSERKQSASDDYSSDSQVEGRKEAKRRRKEEKKLRKEEKRRRREERRRKREQRRAEKLKMKSSDTLTPLSDPEKSPDGYASEKAESEQKKLEIELRKKALESLKAKKGVGH